MRKLAFVLILLTSSLGFAAQKAPERLGDAAELFSEIMATPDKGIPQDLLEKAQCIVLVPGLKKGGFILAGKYGKGFVLCRHSAGSGWGAPASIRIEGGSIGFQIGASSTDVVLLVMNERGMKRLLTSKFTLGGDASVAAGPVGRTASAQTDALLTAEMLSYSRSRGVFAGISLDGATLRQDLDDNEELYGKKIENREILTGNTAPPAAASKLIQGLNKYSARKG
ncbi:MAG TPA: lipid-binding SYLF domain-containing protein [Verrucomicrobiae bacterium]|jgi:lipid-binding SYLF domain-containing protein|nr:lipid-binding SYLF domain-containing protein [Verrucomicrobiae bacterium]HWC00642.1 lipid-binding SYLF domain-containing protein [Bryobacteraceae bacterium]